jgi:hypothetical protein
MSDVGGSKSSEMLVNFYQTTQRYNPEDSNLCNHRGENLKSYTLFIVYKKAFGSVRREEIWKSVEKPGNLTDLSIKVKNTYEYTQILFRQISGSHHGLRPHQESDKEGYYHQYCSVL